MLQFNTPLRQLHQQFHTDMSTNNQNRHGDRYLDCFCNIFTTGPDAFAYPGRDNTRLRSVPLRGSRRCVLFYLYNGRHISGRLLCLESSCWRYVCEPVAGLLCMHSYFVKREKGIDEPGLLGTAVCIVLGLAGAS